MRKKCIICQKEFVTQNGNKTCGHECWRKHYNSHKRRYRKKESIGLKIKHYILKTPVWGVKGLWNGRGYWSKKFDLCIECSTTVYKHHSQGLCESCYSKAKWQAKAKADKDLIKGQRRIRRKEIHKKEEEKRKEGRIWFDKVEKREVEVDTTTINLMSNAE